MPKLYKILINYKFFILIIDEINGISIIERGFEKIKSLINKKQIRVKIMK